MKVSIGKSKDQQFDSENDIEAADKARKAELSAHVNAAASKGKAWAEARENSQDAAIKSKLASAERNLGGGNGTVAL